MLKKNKYKSPSLACQPARITHAMCNEKQLEEAGVTKGMLRISVGLEEVILSKTKTKTGVSQILPRQRISYLIWTKHCRGLFFRNDAKTKHFNSNVIFCIFCHIQIVCTTLCT